MGSPDGRVMPRGAADGSSSPGSADPGGGSAVPQGQVAEDERQHLLRQLLSRLSHCRRGVGALGLPAALAWREKDGPGPPKARVWRGTPEPMYGNPCGPGANTQFVEPSAA